MAEVTAEKAADTPILSGGKGDSTEALEEETLASPTRPGVYLMPHIPGKTPFPREQSEHGKELTGMRVCVKLGDCEGL